MLFAAVDSLFIPRRPGTSHGTAPPLPAARAEAEMRVEKQETERSRAVGGSSSERGASHGSSGNDFIKSIQRFCGRAR
jgi:hypothetical protein